MEASGQLRWVESVLRELQFGVWGRKCNRDSDQARPETENGLERCETAVAIVVRKPLSTDWGAGKTDISGNCRDLALRLRYRCVLG